MTRIILLILFYGIAWQSHGQVIEQVTRQLKEAKTRLPWMKPFLFFSQDKYAPGDTAFFRMYILAEDEKAVSDRSIYTITLIAPQGGTVLKQHVPCEKAGVANQLILPETLIPGVYTLQLFNDDGMKEDTRYIQELTITGDHRLEWTTSAQPTIEVFPEGGHVTAGFINRIIVRANTPIPNCELRSKDGKLASILFNEKGFASIQFLPKQGEAYWVEYNDKGTKLKTALPETDLRQLTLRVYPGPRKSWILDIMGSTVIRKEEVYLILVSQREVIFGQEVKLNEEGRKQIFGGPNFFPEGFSELFLLDATQHIRAYRPVYVPPAIHSKVSVSEIPSETRLRETIRVKLSLSDDAGKPAPGAFAISVINNDVKTKPVLTPDPSLILQTRSFQVDWSGPSEEIEMELICDPGPMQLMNGDEQRSNSSNLTLSGRAFYKDPLAPLPYFSTILIYLHKDLIQYEAPIDNNGFFHFPKIYDLLGSDLIYYKVLSKNKELRGVNVEWKKGSGLEELRTNRLYVSGDLPDEYGILRKQKREIDKSYSFFLKSDSNQVSDANPNAQLEDEFQQADITILPKDYTPFDTMQELILEVIPYLQFRKHQQDSTVRVVLVSKSVFVPQRYSDGNPLYVIDGWMTSDTGYLMRLSPREIVSVKIINDIGKLDRLGNLAANGVLFIQTMNPERTKDDLTKKMFGLSGMSPTLHYSVHYPVDKRIPDLRSTLYWNPFMKTDDAGVAEFEFRTSDIHGDYTVRIMGSRDSGHLVAVEHTFRVKFKK